MKYSYGLNYLDQLKDYVQTSLSIRQNVQQTVQKVEQSEALDKSEQVGNFEPVNVKLEKCDDDGMQSNTGKIRLFFVLEREI